MRVCTPERRCQSARLCGGASLHACDAVPVCSPMRRCESARLRGGASLLAYEAVPVCSPMRRCESARLRGGASLLAYAAVRVCSPTRRCQSARLCGGASLHACEAVQVCSPMRRCESARLRGGKLSDMLSSNRLRHKSDGTTWKAQKVQEFCGAAAGLRGRRILIREAELITDCGACYVKPYGRCRVTSWRGWSCQRIVRHYRVVL
ncbi:uncharacterized protein LOC125240254 isoform X1 [Leguminivora glycinivorella]|uniref:uncharacterized protein LOC125240254 isoform X1 n=1 Tax=Leguminivora glycinivorella TaxID=1035111 RepID=UPI00200D03DF|nr:uncharacterized protein LOC125240254 isoform X1 [Leguminivora glycinivorella]